MSEPIDVPERDVLGRLHSIVAGYEHKASDYTVVRIQTLRDAITRIEADAAEMERLRELLVPLPVENVEAPKPERWETWTATSHVSNRMEWDHKPFAAWPIAGNIVRYVFRRRVPGQRG
jgi:hypothetical protein